MLRKHIVKNPRLIVWVLVALLMPNNNSNSVMKNDPYEQMYFVRSLKKSCIMSSHAEVRTLLRRLLDVNYGYKTRIIWHFH